MVMPISTILRIGLRLDAGACTSYEKYEVSSTAVHNRFIVYSAYYCRYIKNKSFFNKVIFKSRLRFFNVLVANQFIEIRKCQRVFYSGL